MIDKSAAGERYVAITRQDFEDWLENTKGSLGAKKWEPMPNRIGGYFIYLSDRVAIHISTSLASDDTVMAVGEAAMRMRLVAVLNGRVLNKKATGKDYFQRTKNWKTTLLKGAKDLKAAYDKSQDFYEQLASIADPDKYRKDWMDKIEASGLLNSNSFVQDLYSKLQTGSLLTKKQEEALTRALAQEQAPVEEPKGKMPSTRFGKNTEMFLDKFDSLDNVSQISVLRDLYALIKREWDSFIMPVYSPEDEEVRAVEEELHQGLLKQVESIVRLMKSGKYAGKQLGELLETIGPKLADELKQMMRRM